MKPRLKLLTAIAVISVTVLFFAYSAAKQVVDGVAEELLWKYAQISADHDAERLLSPVIKEVNLVKQLASHPNLVSWGMNSNDDVYRSVAENTLETYRWQLKSKSFFVVLDENLAYHYNDVESVRQESFFRYFVTPNSVKDQWYFKQKNSGRDLKVNIATDAHLGLTRVWINKSIVKDGQFLGIVGTGIETSQLFAPFEKQHSSAIRTLFVDDTNRVQFSISHNEVKYDLTDSKKTKPTLDEYLANSDDYTVLERLMQRQKSGEEPEVLLVEQESGNAVVAIQYIDALGWYELTFVTIDEMVPHWVSMALYLPLVGLVMGLALLSYWLLLNRWIVPYEQLSLRLNKMLKNHAHYRDVGAIVDKLERELISSRICLEDLVASRTEQIDKLTVFDPPTGLHNCNGLKRELSAELARASREQFQFGLIWIDAGLASDQSQLCSKSEHDQALLVIATSLLSSIREYDVAARWGDDEFLLLVRTDNNQTLFNISNRILRQLDKNNSVTMLDRSSAGGLSIGGTLIQPHMTIQEALALADSSLYKAKFRSSSAIYIHKVSDAA